MDKQSNQIYLDPTRSPEERAQDLLSQMSLDEKMGQVNCIFPVGALRQEAEAELKRLHGAGEVSCLEITEQADPHAAAQWQTTLQKLVMEASEHHIPGIFHMEGLTGAQIIGSVVFPSGIARASSFDPKLEKQVAQVVAKEEVAMGCTHTFAPVLDINRDARMGRQAESYGEDATLAATMGEAYVHGIQETEVNGRRSESVAKHFLAFHNSCGGVHGSNSDTPPRLLQELYGKPFQAAIAKANMHGIMPCYCSVDGEQASASSKILTDLLRKDMGFDGICVSDYSAVEQVHSVRKMGETMAEAGLMCMSAGMEVEQPMSVAYGEELKKMFASGEADMEILDRAVLRVLTAKFRMGLFEHPFAFEGKDLDACFHVPEHEAISLQSAREAIVLLKNSGALPISKEVKKILVVGPQANNARFYFGGYTVVSMLESKQAAKQSMAGIGTGKEEKVDENTIKTLPGSNIQSDEDERFNTALTRVVPGCETILDQLKKALPDVEIAYAKGYPIAGNDTSGYAEALALAKDADLILMTLGGKYGTGSIATMGEGIDATNINLPQCQDGFILEASKLGVPMVGVHIDGRPISSNIADQYLDAIVEAWTLGSNAAQAITEVLTGGVNPGGKLPVSVAYNAGQIPIYYNHPNGSAWHQAEGIGFLDYADCPHTPRYFFGHGLSYTNFAYSDLKLDCSEVAPDGKVTITCTIENTGSMAGTEIVQLYVIDEYASQVRPVKELAGFGRVELQPGEKKHVSFTLSASQMAFLDADMKWKVERGKFLVEIGASSNDIRLTGEYRVTDNQWIRGRDRAFYADFAVAE